MSLPRANMADEIAKLLNPEPRDLPTRLAITHAPETSTEPAIVAQSWTSVAVVFGTAFSSRPLVSRARLGHRFTIPIMTPQWRTLFPEPSSARRIRRALFDKGATRRARTRGLGGTCRGCRRHGRGACRRAGSPWRANPGLASGAGLRSAASRRQAYTDVLTASPGMRHPDRIAQTAGDGLHPFDNIGLQEILDKIKRPTFGFIEYSAKILSNDSERCQLDTTEKKNYNH